MYHGLLHDLRVARPFRDGIHLHDVPLHLHDEVGELLLAVCIRCIWETVREGGAGADVEGLEADAAASSASPEIRAACSVAEAPGSEGPETEGTSAVSFVSSFCACCTTEPKSFLAASNATWLYSRPRVPSRKLSAMRRR